MLNCYAQAELERINIVWVAAREENQAIGKSVGGNTTKIHMAIDVYGLRQSALSQLDTKNRPSQ